LYYILHGFASIVSLLKPSQLQKIANFLGFLSFEIIRYRRKLVIDNLHIAFGDSKSDKEINNIAKASWNSLFLTFLEFFWGKNNDIAADVKIVNGEYLRAALDKGQGGFILACHLGNWEAMGVKVSRCFRPAHTPVKKVGSDAVDKFVVEMRTKNGFPVIARKSSGDGYRAIRKGIKNGDLVGFMMDQSRPGEPRLPFFGKTAKTNTTLARIWDKSKRPPIVPCLMKRVAACKHELHFFPEVEMPITGEKEADIIQQTILFNSILEESIRFCPEQYMWMHNRWK